MNNNVTYFDSFGRILREIKIFIDKSAVVAAEMCGYFCIGFIDFMFKGKTLTDFTNLFSPSNFDKNGDIIFKKIMINI